MICMRLLARLVPSVTLFVAMAPAVASAQTFSKTVGLFNVFVGLMLTVAILTYGIGFIVWVVRLGTWPTYRTEAIKIMEWSVVILFVLVVLLGIVQFFQNHPRAAAYTVSAIVILLIVAAILFLAAKGGEKAEKKEENRR